MNRCNNYTPVLFEGIALSGQILTGDVGDNAPQGDLWLLPLGVAVLHYTKKEVRILSAGDIAVVAVEMCRDNPAMRAALLDALSKL